MNTKLSGREVEICHLLGSGLSVKEVAMGLTLSEYTVRAHVQNTLRALRLHLQPKLGEGIGKLRVPILWRYAWDGGLVARVFSGENVLSEKHTKLAVALASGRFMKFVASELGITVYQAQGRLQEAQKKIRPILREINRKSRGLKIGGTRTYIVTKYVYDLGLVEKIF